MKKQNQNQPSIAPVRVASTKLILTCMFAAAASLVLPAASHAQSAYKFTMDGAFTGGIVPNGSGGWKIAPGTEWSDVTPTAFHSVSSGATAGSVPVGSTNANTLLYASIGTDATGTAAQQTIPSLHLMYDFLPRTSAPNDGELLASVTFPITTATLGVNHNVSVLFSFSSTLGEVINVDETGNSDPNSGAVVSAASLGITGVFAPGVSTLTPFPNPTGQVHLLAELEVPLRIPAGFAAPGTTLNPTGTGIDPATGLYSPNPVFWGAAGAADGGGASLGPGSGLQSASAATIQINPDGSLAITPTVVETPEPSSAVLLLGSVAMVAARRRKSVGTV